MRAALIPDQRGFRREEWIWMRAGMSGPSPPARIEQLKHELESSSSNFAREYRFTIHQ